MHHLKNGLVSGVIAGSLVLLPTAADAMKRKPGGPAAGGAKIEDVCEKEKVQKCTVDKNGIKKCVWVDGEKCAIY